MGSLMASIPRLEFFIRGLHLQSARVYTEIMEVTIVPGYVLCTSFAALQNAKFMTRKVDGCTTRITSDFGGPSPGRLKRREGV